VQDEIDLLIRHRLHLRGPETYRIAITSSITHPLEPGPFIQRFGRIDRIGSKNASIQLVNYWPDISLDEYIRLKERVESRMSSQT